jgi:hypothetical protein
LKKKKRFPAEEYSHFKFGDKYYEKIAELNYSMDLFEYRELLLSDKEIIILPSLYLSIPTASNFLCYYFQKQNSFYFKNNKKSMY